MQTELVVPGITDPNTLVCLSRAKTYKQYCKAVADALGNKCPFCQLDRVYNKMILETDNWQVFHCQPPEKNTKYHVLFAPKWHFKSIGQLRANEVLELFRLIAEVKEKLEITSCGILIRDGDARLSAGTIEHLHVHMMIPDGTGRVESPFYKGDASDAESLVRAIVFEKLRLLGGIVSGITAEELALVEGRV